MESQSAPCPHFGVCGNCSLQELTDPDYRKVKMGAVSEAFLRRGLRPLRWEKPVFVAAGNRRRLNFSAKQQDGKLVIGFHKRQSGQLVAPESCLIAHPKLLKIRAELKPLMESMLRRGGSVEIFLQDVAGKTDMLLTGPKPSRQRLEKFLNASSVARVSWRQQERAPIEVLVRRENVSASFGGLRVALPPDAFLQPTEIGEKALVDAVLGSLPQKGRFVDLFSGCGTFTGPMAARGSVDAFESSALAVNALSKAGRGKNLQVFQRDLYRNPLKARELNRYDAVIFDPPRAGCLAQAIEMGDCKVPILIGISCNPSTFARDARLLCDGGYWLQSLQVFDQFLWSHHAEVVGVFTRRKLTSQSQRNIPSPYR